MSAFGFVCSCTAMTASAADLLLAREKHVQASMCCRTLYDDSFVPSTKIVLIDRSLAMFSSETAGLSFANDIELHRTTLSTAAPTTFCIKASGLISQGPNLYSPAAFGPRRGLSASSVSMTGAGPEIPPSFLTRQK